MITLLFDLLKFYLKIVGIFVLIASNNTAQIVSEIIALTEFSQIISKL